MTVKKTLYHKIVSVFLCFALLMTYFPIATLTAKAAAWSTPITVADPGTADTWEDMMGTDSDGNRYAGRVWADK